MWYPYFFALVTVLELKMWDLHDYIKTWLGSHRCASDTQIHTASQNLQWNRKIHWRSSCRQMLTLFKLFGVAILFIWERHSHTSFFSTTSLHMTTSTVQMKAK